MEKELNINKDTKQKIALNYSIMKNKELELKLIKEGKILVIDSKRAILNINEIKKEKIIELINKVNLIDNETITNSFISESLSIDGLSNFPKGFNGINHYVSEDNKVFATFDREKIDILNKKDIKLILDENNFNYFSLLKIKENILEDNDFKYKFENFLMLKKEYFDSLQTSFNNCYELIRNIRTLERIRKNFKDVDKYLPDNITVKEDSVSIIEKFKTL